MSDATERLRAMLDERGVEHYDGTETTLWGYEPTGESTGAYRFAADETSGGRMQVRMFNLTPEQAIEATLGRGECRRQPHINTTIGDDFLKQSGWDCSECGYRLDFPASIKYCPNCGRKVKR